MNTKSAWVTDDNASLLTDLYELTMLQAYHREAMYGSATFTLSVRGLPKNRNFLIAAGLADALHYLANLRFSEDVLTYLNTLPQFDAEFLEWLRDFRFTGDVFAVLEGTPVFADEPILEIVAPLPEAQLVETFVMNQVHLQTVIASKAARVVLAAQGRTVVDFGLRRTHGSDAGMKAARAAYIAGVDATSNVLAGSVYQIPVAGTMAHSYVQAHDSEVEALERFARHYHGTTLLVDTYDTLKGVQHVIDLAERLGNDFTVKAIRLDSGDLAELALNARKMLDDSNLEAVEIFASGGLDEYSVRGIISSGAPIDGFGVGTKMNASTDAPTLDITYKLAEYEGRGRTKLSPGKPILPGRKQVFRFENDGTVTHDEICGIDEPSIGRPLLQQVMKNGKILAESNRSLEEIRSFAEKEISKLPERLRELEPTEFRVDVSKKLELDRFTAAKEASGNKSP